MNSKISSTLHNIFQLFISMKVLSKRLAFDNYSCNNHQTLVRIVR